MFPTSKVISRRLLSSKPSSLLLRPGNIFNHQLKLFIKCFGFALIQAMKAGLTPTEIVAPHTTHILEALLMGKNSDLSWFSASRMKEPI